MAPSITITKGPGSGLKAGVCRTSESGADRVTIEGAISEISPGLQIEMRVMSGANEIVGWRRATDGFKNDGSSFKGTYGMGGGGRALDISSVTAHATAPVVTTATNHGWASGLTFNVTFDGTTGGPAGWEDGTFVATSTGLNTFTVGADTTTFTPTGGEAQLDTLIPCGGFYTFEFRTIDLDGTAIFTDTSQTATWGVGVMGVILGQSNMQDMHETIDTPDIADAKVGLYVNSIGGGGTHPEDEWFDPVATPTGNGITKLANELQAHITADYGDIPVFIVSLATAGSALTVDADYAGGGHWFNGHQDTAALFRNTLIDFDNSSPSRTVEFILWQQGEAEATKTAAQTLLVGGAQATQNIGAGEWYQAFQGFLRKLKGNFLGNLNHEPAIAIGHVASLFVSYLVQRTINSSTIREDQTKVALEEGLGLIAANDVEVVTHTTGIYTAVDIGIHWFGTGHETFATRAAEVLATKMGILAGSATGPKISKAMVGTESNRDDMQKVTVYIDHDQGTDLTLGTQDSVPCWTVADRKGAIAVTAVSKAATDRLELTLERDIIAALRTAGYEDRGDEIAGNQVTVGYLEQDMYCLDFSSGGDYFIRDNASAGAGADMPLLPSFGFADVSEKVKANDMKTYVSGPTDGTDVENGRGVTAAISAVPSTSSITIAAPDTWDTNFATPGEDMVYPGQRCSIHTALGVYVADAIVKNVTAYTNDATAITVEFTHDWANQSAASPQRIPAITDVAIFWRNPRSSGVTFVEGNRPYHFDNRDGDSQGPSFAEEILMKYYPSGVTSREIQVLRNEGDYVPIITGYKLDRHTARDTEVGFKDRETGFYIQAAKSDSLLLETGLDIHGPKGWDVVVRSSQVTAGTAEARVFVQGKAR
jgi:hypothetical protein